MAALSRPNILIAALLLRLLFPATASARAPESEFVPSSSAESFPSAVTLDEHFHHPPSIRTNLTRSSKYAVLLADEDLLLMQSQDGNHSSGAAAATGPEVEPDTSMMTAPSTRRNGWGWRRASLAEYVVVPVAAAGTWYFEKENGQHVSARWRGHDGFDEAIRRGVRLGSLDARDAARSTADVLMGVLIAAPVVDSAVTLGIRDRNWDALWQTSMINLESFTFTSLASSLMQNLIAREKPLVRNCKDINHCEETQPNRSMPSGHTAFAFTGAGLLCTHHDYQGLYADPAAERWACATGLTLATATGVVRMMADGHYATDVLAGAGIGLFSGFLLPRWLHYDRPKSAEEEGAGERSFLNRAYLAPELREGGGALICTVTF